ncbi:hypothetical protein GCM10023093_16250 [Nemorincola caseinilytica]|uniref:DUF559 domain-containing protein n=1 Tax=Nemorincola caseinilytica TaxID=2054315 RepID=A0ABP8NC94_9BACT
MEKKMFYGATNLIFDNARKLRNDLTNAELVLWGYLKQRPLGYKFRRQHPLGIYIADFYCHALKLVIEVDGSVHEDPEMAEKDKVRQDIINSLGVKMIRFRNEEVEKRLETVIDKIENHIINNRSPKAI